MIVYLIMLLLSIVFIFIAQKSKNKVLKVILYICSILPLFLVSALRYDLGTDYTKTYVSIFRKLSVNKVTKDLEISFELLVRACLLISNNPNILFVVTAFITLVLIMITILTKSQNKILSVIIFVLGGFYFETLNLVRQYIAIAIIFLSSQLLLKKRWKYDILFLLIVIFSVTIHFSSIVALVIVLLNKRTFVDYKWLIPISVGIIMFKSDIVSLLERVIEMTKYKKYLDISGEISYLNIIKNIFLFIVMQYVYNQAKKQNKLENADRFYLNIQGLTLLVVCLGACNFQFSRIAIYFYIFQIMSIPHFITKLSMEPFENLIKKIFKKENLKIKLKPFVYIGVVLLFGVNIFYTNVLNNDNEVIPYKTIINKDITIY
ncbi:MAG: EpsG family protein [Clostridia bacterium]|nr:EpsG family protein [Clostridia bacterium]